jgi:multisubunit Na+/H+ antiporter MnhB subunit
MQPKQALAAAALLVEVDQLKAFNQIRFKMNAILKLEDAAKLMAAYWLSLYLGYSWWVFFAWLLAPDLSMIGYVVNTRVGATLYNLAHHQGLALAILIAGIYFSSPGLTLTGIILFGHSAMDRLLGYGLKYPDDFKHTHLGWIGKK